MLIYTIQADLYALLILAIIYLSFKKKADLKNTSNQIFLLVVFLNAAALTLDIIMIILDGIPGQAASLALMTVTLLFYILNPLPCLVWLAYVDFFIYHDEKRMKRYALIAVIPAAINGVAAVASLFGGQLFWIGPDNVYHRGTLFFVMPVICYLYMVFTVVYMLYNRNKIRRDDLLPLLFFAIPPLVAGIIQSAIYGLALLWPALTISLLVVFIYIQSKLMNTDHLTGLFNRREFDYYLADWPRRRFRKKYIAGIVLDMDFFKDINDTYGHIIGDTALAKMSEILRDSFSCNDFIARVGGDEFAVIIEVDTDSEINLLVERLEKNIAAFNTADKEPYRLSVSIGYGVFSPEDGLTLTEFFHGLDTRMYEAKKSSRR